MYFIYKIENLVNHKCYIGSSDQNRGLYTRWYEHQQNARLEKRVPYNYPLSKAIRKYGVENFNYTILIKDIETPEARHQLEQDMILEYHSLVTEKGYNQTLNTEYSFDDPLVRDKHSTKVCAISTTSDEIIYFQSITEAAREMKTDRASIHACIAGQVRHSVVKGYIYRLYDPKTKEIIQNNIPLSSAGRYNKLIEINGEKKILAEWCREYNITRQTVYRRIRTKGMTIEEAITSPKRR